MCSDGPTFSGPWSLNCYEGPSQPATIRQHLTRSKGPFKDPEDKMAENGVMGGALDNGPYSDLLPISKEVGKYVNWRTSNNRNMHIKLSSVL